MRTLLEQLGTIKPINFYNKPFKATLELPPPKTLITHLEDPPIQLVKEPSNPSILPNITDKPLKYI